MRKFPIIERDMELSLDDDKRVETVVQLSRGEIQSKKIRLNDIAIHGMNVRSGVSTK